VTRVGKADMPGVWTAARCGHLWREGVPTPSPSHGDSPTSSSFRPHPSPSHCRTSDTRPRHPRCRRERGVPGLRRSDRGEAAARPDLREVFDWRWFSSDVVTQIVADAPLPLSPWACAQVTLSAERRVIVSSHRHANGVSICRRPPETTNRAMPIEQSSGCARCPDGERDRPGGSHDEHGACR
jgi:isopentenyldiphosphate isomerase